MTRTSAWATKVMAIIQSGNQAAAIAQIKVAPSVKDLQALQLALRAAPAARRTPPLMSAVDENLALLSAPRLHRAP